jgi:2-aminoethylphosphonate transport system substrate-binding protein
MTNSRFQTRIALSAGLTLSIAALTGCAGSATADSSPTSGDSDTVTVYTADGLNDGDNSYYAQVFAAFAAETGIKVQVVEGGSGEVLQRLNQESSNTQADLPVTLPPFIQIADEDGLLTPYEPAGTENVPAEDKDPDGAYTTLVNNYIGFIRNTAETTEGHPSHGRTCWIPHTRANSSTPPPESPVTARPC